MKRRNTNFTYSEKVALVELVREKKTILENKQTDAVTQKDKELCWEKLAVQFNSNCTNANRSSITLKSCWDNLKKRTRKHFAEVRRQRFATGGGIADIKDDPLSEQVRTIIEPSVDGVSNEFDSDEVILVIKDTECNADQFINTNEEFDNEDMIIETLDEDKHNWEGWNPANLRTKKSQELDITHDDDLTFEDTENVSAIQMSSKTSKDTSKTRPVKRKKTTPSTTISATARNARFAALAESKVELVDMIKEDMKAKCDIEIDILKVQLEREKVQLEISKAELKIKLAILNGKLPI